MKKIDMKKSIIANFLTIVFLAVFMLNINGVRALGPNLVQNPSVESGDETGPDNWTVGGYGDNDRLLTYETLPDETKALKVSISTYVDGDAKWYFDSVPVSEGNLYRFSDRYKSNTTSYLYTAYNLSDSSTVFELIATIPSSNGVWITGTQDFTAPANAVDVTIYHAIQGVGEIVTDDYSLSFLASANENQFSTGIISLSFDDGWISHYTNVLPIMNLANLNGTFYVMSKPMDNSLLSDYMGSVETTDLKSFGNEIGGHTIHHCNLLTLPDLSGCALDLSGGTTNAVDEVVNSRNTLLSLGFSDLQTFAYPNGAYNDSIKSIIENAGYGAARSIDDGFNSRFSDKYALKNLVIDQNLPIDRVKERIDTAISNKLWLILTFHEVDDGVVLAGGHDGAITTAYFQEVIDYIVSKKVLDPSSVDVKTVRDVLPLLDGYIPPEPINTAPTLTLNGDAVVDINVGETFVDDGATANDAEQGDITSNIIVDGTVDNTTEGVYVLTYSVSDAGGLTAPSVVRTVNVHTVDSGDDDDTDNGNGSTGGGSSGGGAIGGGGWIVAPVIPITPVVNNLLEGIITPSLEEGQVLGATTCADLITQNLSKGNPKNSREQVKLLQAFLNGEVDAGLPTTGYFGPLTKAASMKFQEKYKEEILTPLKLKSATGFVYRSTRAKINSLNCEIPEVVSTNTN